MKKYEVVQTMGIIKRDICLGYQFSIEELDAEKLIQDYVDFNPYVGKRVRVIIMIESE